MKYLIVSDIHGSIESARIIIDNFHKHDCDYIICLGDVLYHGPRNDLPLFYEPKNVWTDADENLKKSIMDFSEGYKDFLNLKKIYDSYNSFETDKEKFLIQIKELENRLADNQITLKIKLIKTNMLVFVKLEKRDKLLYLKK